MVALSPHLDKGVPSILCGDMNSALRPEHRYLFELPDKIKPAVNAEEAHSWRVLVAEKGNFIEAPGDGAHSCVYKSGIRILFSIYCDHYTYDESFKSGGQDFSYGLCREGPQRDNREILVRFVVDFFPTESE